MPFSYPGVKTGAAACHKVGVPPEHEAAIQSVADGQLTIIGSREIGSPLPTGDSAVGVQPLQWGYDTKGYRIHGKSCNWGPMAGFVLRDPVLSKKGANFKGKQEHAHQEALRDVRNSDQRTAGWYATTVPLCVPEDRIRYLQSNAAELSIQWLMRRPDLETADSSIPGGQVWEGAAHHDSGISMQFVFIPHKFNDLTLYGLYAHGASLTPGRECSEIQYKSRSSSNALTYHELEAMANPPDYAAHPKGHFKNAVTGDYDLHFAWPHPGTSGITQSFLDDQQRIGGISATARDDKYQTQNHYEHNRMGNISENVQWIAQMINSSVGATHTGHGSVTGRTYPQRNVVWHSDEAARPFVNDIDLPLIAWIPKHTHAFCIETAAQLAELILWADSLGYYVQINQGWLGSGRNQIQAESFQAFIRTHAPMSLVTSGREDLG